MISKHIEQVEKAYLKSEIPSFDVGDTVTVRVRIVEGDKERIQPYTGVVIARRGGGLSETFTVRRIVNNEGVERVFGLHSPRLHGITVSRKGKVRRAKLFFLRERVGKARRLRERRRGTAAAGAESPGEQESEE